jgi:carbon storage regulator
MLVFSRREGEKVTIGEDIQVTVLRIDEEQVRLGFTAPDEVKIHRFEVRERIRRGEAPPTRPRLRPQQARRT